ncbi:peroxiredoxin-like family protein [Bosea psychrotolerans]|uniref:thioredoxin-dependent peroxiredoxin n=1 Tax=Bosea psychrotolerans TaxID=1871628 RepID=A0A2S4M7U6_9HYPH|nr:peroxiredoxin-like family protein [Bosea psychrotolerans]POR50808.1 peroxiredoxin [Bosea psychrotolerans]
MNARPLSQRLSEISGRHARERQHVASAYERMIAGLVARGVAAGAVSVGDIIPPFALPNAEGRFVHSADLLSSGPLVISFYRGSWCFYCESELTALRDAQADIVAAGGRLVAVSAEAGGRTAATKRDFKLPFDVLCDIDLGLSLSFGLVFPVDDEVRRIYGEIGFDLARFNGNDSWFLPIPATYVVGTDGRVVAAHVDPDFRRRMEPADIVATLLTLKR